MSALLACKLLPRFKEILILEFIILLFNFVIRFEFHGKKGYTCQNHHICFVIPSNCMKGDIVIGPFFCLIHVSCHLTFCRSKKYLNGLCIIVVFNNILSTFLVWLAYWILSTPLIKVFLYKLSIRDTQLHNLRL